MDDVMAEILGASNAELAELLSYKKPEQREFLPILTKLSDQWTKSMAEVLVELDRIAPR